MVEFSTTTGAFGKDSNGDAVTGLTYDFSEISYSVSDAGSTSLGFDLAGWVGAGLNLSGDFAFEVGFTGAVHVDLGFIDTTLDIGTENFVTDGVADEAAALDTSGFTVEAFEVTPVGFDLGKSYIELGLRAALEANLTVDLTGYYDLGILGDGSFGTTLLDNVPLNIEYLRSLIPNTPFDIVGGFDGNIFKFELGDFVEVSLDVPVFEYEDPEYVTNEETGIDTLHITGESSPFLSLEIGLASFILPVGIGPIGFDLGEELLGEDLAEYFNIAVEGGLFDAKLVGTLSVGQEITIESEVLAEVVSSLGETLTGSLGDEFIFDTPEGEGEFTVTANYTLSQTVEAVTSLILNSTIDWRVLYLQFEASVDVPLYSDTFEAVAALFEDSIDLGELLGLTVSFELFNDLTTYLSEAGTEHYTISYENYVTAASGAMLSLTTNQRDVVGGDIDNTITGNQNGNRLSGMGGDDVIYGGAGNDVISGGSGSDSLFGGHGLDTVNYRQSQAAVTVSLLTGMGSGAEAEGDTITDVERVVGSEYSDDLAGSDLANFLTGRGGDDTLTGNGGNDKLLGGNGADVIDGGAGFDTLLFDRNSSGVTVDLAAGTGSGGQAEGDTYVGIEAVRGTDNDDVLTGSAGNNRLSGMDGDDTIYGGDGNDTVSGGEGIDDLHGGLGVDTLDFRNAVAGVSVYLADGTSTQDFVAADTFSGFENVIGTGFSDWLVGTDGDNRIDGGEGADLLEGGGGDDTFILTSGDTVRGGDGLDMVIIDGVSDDYIFTALLESFAYEISRVDGGSNQWYLIQDVEAVQFNNSMVAVDWLIS